MASPILVTGAAGRIGAVGRTVTELLLKQGKAVRGMVRRQDERAQALRDFGAEVVVGDLLDLQSMHRAIAGCETMYFGMSVSDAYSLLRFFQRIIVSDITSTTIQIKIRTAAILLSLQLFLQQIHAAAKKTFPCTFLFKKCCDRIGRMVCGSERGHFTFVGNPVRCDSLVTSGRPMFSGVLGRPDCVCGVPKIMTNLFFVF